MQPRCEWCDTDFLTYEEMTAAQIIGEIEKYPCQNVILTGGEPMLNDSGPFEDCLMSMDITYQLKQMEQ